MKRILFVDDEPRILEGLQRMLRSQRNRWEMVFARGGDEALALLGSGPFDVIVTDMRMPGMDGARLLQQVQERFPSVIRVVLSGHVEMEAALRAAPVAHQFLSKPCDPERLREVIERSCRCTSMVADETVRRVVGAVGKLPSLPSTCAALLAALEDPDIPLTEVGKIIEQDVGMSAKILQLVNSAFFGLLREVGSVAAAVSYLGLDIVKHLVLSAHIFRTFHPVHPVAGFSLDAFEAHSRLAARIAARLPAPDAVVPTAVVTALLHDTGKLVLAARLPAQLEVALRVSREERRPLYAVEESLIGTGHAEIGAYLLGLWRLPLPIVDAVYRHHHPAVEQSTQGLDILACTHIADALAFELPQGPPGDAPPGCGLLDERYVAALGVADRIPVWRALAQQVYRDQETTG
jgi:HD-like signal output (HDOD) protein/CheY-like chemotaxis protein